MLYYWKFKNLFYIYYSDKYLYKTFLLVFLNGMLERNIIRRRYKVYWDRSLIKYTLVFL